MCNVNIELESTDSFATCRGCEKLVCRGENCCQWVESIGIWECAGCQSNRVIQQKAGEWLLNQLTTRLKQPGPVELKEANLLGLGLDTDDARSTTSSTVSVNQRIKVREFIEELLSSMLHGPLDDVSVGQLMKHESCKYRSAGLLYPPFY
uniref:FYVE-type zinc finger domain-containing protein n=1 Tax=Anopheles culicifacies TaxID=139723 RepID=A0A182LZT6_9DIPT